MAQNLDNSENHTNYHAPSSSIEKEWKSWPVHLTLTNQNLAAGICKKGVLERRGIELNHDPHRWPFPGVLQSGLSHMLPCSTRGSVISHGGVAQSGQFWAFKYGLAVTFMSAFMRKYELLETDTKAFLPFRCRGHIKRYGKGHNACWLNLDIDNCCSLLKQIC